MIIRSLYTKLSAVLLGLFVLVGITFVLVSLYSTEMYQQEVSQKLNREIARRIVSEKIIMENERINEKALKEIFHMLMVINPSIEIYLLDPAGNILAFSAEPGRVKRKKVALEPIQAFLEGKVVFPLLGDDPRDVDKTKVFTAARIPEEGRLEGYLYVILGGEIYDSIAQKLQTSYISKLSTWAILSSLLVALVTGLIMFACLTKRLRRLAAAMNSYTNGMLPGQLDLPVTTWENPADEIDLLVTTFKKMSARIEEQMESLKRSDTLRRELVANISHDLRTPLATLQGYIETLLIKDSSLSTEERLNYLDIGIRHCKRLSSLVSDLFELAKLDAQDTQVHCEPFSIGELVQDIVQKFRLSAKERKVAILANIGKELPVVSADIALIERVFENLIENALRHTSEGGTVSIVLHADRDILTVIVRDTGRGIPESELPHIFDRFYQIDSSREGRAGHSGLGLAISKRILELHGTTIRVASTLNVGTTFTFSLPVYRTNA